MSGVEIIKPHAESKRREMTYYLGCMRHRRRELELTDRRRVNSELSDIDDNGRMARPLNKDQKAQVEGERTRTAIINWLADKLTDPSCPLTTEEMNHLRMVSAYFPEGRETAEKIDRMFADKPALRQAILLSTIVTCLDRLLA